ncbi:ProQ/FINO family protein [Photobacterium kishitanii]|uniref:ProQ/FinO domain-containing protein n=1 Tax=Photobacterium kishitanii TaxID=318456 RepID=A0A2T3KM86_9GAMM|nr:ProQ/FINO family protein [Photobacterium kishitanii]PSV00913.1 hypothetical protein C9J27_02480 [Photobacterium kishitanii]
MKENIQNNSKKGKPKVFQNKKISASQRRHKKDFKKCQKIWPHLFVISGAKPFAIQIRDALLKDADNKSVKISNGTIYNAIYWMSRTFQYQRALSVCAYRIDIHGEQAEAVQEKHREEARKKCSEMNKKKTSRTAKKKITTKDPNAQTKTKVITKKKKNHYTKIGVAQMREA